MKVTERGYFMKSIYLFCTKPWVYLTELPVLILLAVSIAFNGKSEEKLKFYPLIILLIFSAIFIFIYFFKMISITTDEIKYIGLFSSKDSAFIKEKKTLEISLHRFGNIRLLLFGDAAEAPAFEWMKAEDVAHREICLFRGRALGGKYFAKKILNYFALDKEALEGFDKEGFFYEDERITIKTSKKNEVLCFQIHFKITII